jgi:hypothetical protein
MAWFQFREGMTSLSVALQHFVGDAKGYFEAGDHLSDTIVESGAAVPVGPHHPDHPPPPSEPTVIEGPETVEIALPIGGTGPVNLPGTAEQDEGGGTGAAPPKQPIVA